MISSNSLLPITVAFGCDEKYVKHLGVVIQSILENAEPTDKHVFHIVTSDISECSQKRLQLLIRDRASLSIHLVDSNLLKGFPETSHPVSAYLRLLIPDLLSSLDKVLYLDADLIVLSSLQSLWNIPLNEYPLAAAIDSMGVFGIDIPFFKSLRLKEGQVYFNSGVLLLNLKLLRELKFFNKIQAWIKENSALMVNSDQDALNSLYGDVVKPIHLRWNLQVPLIYLVHFGWGYTQEQYEAVVNPAIIHYVTQRKPWFRQYKLPYQHLYFKYLKQTPWKEDLEPFPFNKRLQRMGEEVDWVYKYLRSRLRKILGRFPQPVFARTLNH